MDTKLDTYKTIDTLGKSQLDLIIQVYDGALRSFERARTCYQTQDTESGYQELERAKRFLMHLYTTLDFERGGEVADRLGHLYAFTLNQINLVEATHDLKQLDKNVAVMRNLRDGWAGLKRQLPETEEGQSVSESMASAGQFEASA
ncbi:MAG: flagellar export chaperone FliS [Candidatus Zixiibacteriota bacterium]